MALFDQDRFERHDDVRGHTAGGEALQMFAHALAATTRR